MKLYPELQKIYKASITWNDFINNVSSGRGKQIILSVLEEGWYAKVYNDIQYIYNISPVEVNTFLNRLECILLTTPEQLSAQEIAIQLVDLKDSINVVRGYLRYAYYVALDNEDDVISKLDEVLATLGTGTPSRKECAESYTMITGKYIDSNTVIIDASSADDVAVILITNIEQLQSKLTTAANDIKEKIKEEIFRLNELHVKLTGKNVITI